MRKTHTILIPSMLDFHFPLIIEAFRSGGYKAEALESTSSPQTLNRIISQGLEYTNNDICFPANLIIGQFMTALKSGRYDLHKTALLLPQTGGGCRACSYIYLLRKALKKAGFECVPVVSLNVSGVEHHSGFRITPIMIITACAAVFYGDMLMRLYNEVSTYEANKGQTFKLTESWKRKISIQLSAKKWLSVSDMKIIFDNICLSFSKIPRIQRNVKKVCLAGELYIKYCALGNGGLEDILRQQSCEIHMGGFAQYIMYLADCSTTEIKLYGRITPSGLCAPLLIKFMAYIQKLMNKALTDNGFEPITEYKKLKKLSQSRCYGETMGDGWLIEAEISEALKNGCTRAIAVVPFGCLVSHSCVRGKIGKLRKQYPHAFIYTLDYDSGLSEVNRANRIKMILS